MVKAALVAAAALFAAVQFPAIQNGTTETAASANLVQDVARLGSGSDPVWIAWSEPMLPGERNLCSTWSSQAYSVRGQYLEGWAGENPPPPFPTPPGPVALEAGTRLVMFARLIEGKVERLRVIGDDCPVDAGGRKVVRINGVAPDDSVRFLETLVQPASTPTATDRSHTSSALSGIALHQTPMADDVLERLASTRLDSDVGRQAASWLGRARGRRGVAVLMRLIDQPGTPQASRALVAALAQSPAPDTYDTLVRLARSHTNERVRVEAVRAISTSTDPRAKAFLTEVLK